MGTNYYHFPDQVKATTPVEVGLHIGKNSAGWVFNFQAYETPQLKTVDDYRKFLKDGVIYNEYDEEIPYEEFWKIVAESLLDFYGEAPYSLNNLPEDDSASIVGIEEWMNEGFTFTKNDFC